jgi:iron complex transport system substrate-binding protein
LTPPPPHAYTRGVPLRDCMKRLLSIITLVAIVFGGAWALRFWLAQPEAPEGPARPELVVREVAREFDCSRIISLAPSVTETLFALGLGQQVVGVTRYCEFPAEVTELPSVGGYFDPNYEQMITLQPTLVVLLPGHAEHRQRLADLKFETLEANQESVPEILKSVESLGAACGVRPRGRELVAELRARQRKIEELTLGLPRPGVLIVVDREMGTGRIRDLYVAGRSTFYDDLLSTAGGSNVYDGKLIQYPTLSLEGLLRVNPQVIIEIIPQLAERGLTVDEIRKDWESVPSLNAVREERIFVLAESYAAVPGPRYVLLLEAMARAIHPDADWEVL